MVESLAIDQQASRYFSSHEHAAQRGLFDYIIGIDEAGRGPVCGPVTAAAFCWRRPAAIEQYDWASLVADSKAMKEDVRERVFAEMSQDFEEYDEECDFIYAHCSAGERVIDESDILSCTLDCMYKAYELLRRSLASRSEQPIAADNSQIRVFIDGNKIPEQMTKLKNVRTTAVVKGDSEIFTISCASIVAKCSRDKMMRALAKEYPDYGIEIHKGYLTQMHKNALAKYGPSAMHRLTFEPCKSMILKNEFPLPRGRTIDCIVSKEELAALKKKKRKTIDLKTAWKISKGPSGEMVLQPPDSTTPREP